MSLGGGFAVQHAVKHRGQDQQPPANFDDGQLPGGRGFIGLISSDPEPLRGRRDRRGFRPGPLRC